MNTHAKQLFSLVVGFASIACCTPIFAISQDSIEQKIRSDYETKNFESLNRFLTQNVYDKVLLRQVQRIAMRVGAVQVSKAIDATLKLDIETQKLGITQKELLTALLLIETQNGTGKGFQKNAKIGLAHDILYDPPSDSHFIILEGKGAFVGRGKKKVVSKSILYDRKKGARLVARAEEIVKHYRELELTKMLQDAPGIFKTLAFYKGTKKGKKTSTIFSELYSPGSLAAAFNLETKFTAQEKQQIALNILKGLESLHSKGIVHRDLGARNYLIDISKGAPGKRQVSACIADLGRADYISNVAKSKPQGNTTYTAPEGLFMTELKSSDYFAMDVFAVGCVLYQVQYGKKAPWQDMSYVKDTKRSLKVRHTELVHRIRKATQTRREQLDVKHLNTSLSSEEKLERTILCMLHIDPSKRGSAESLRNQVEQLAKLSSKGIRK